MFVQTATQIQSRFKALAVGLDPLQVNPARQARATALIPTVRAIKPGVYIVGKAYIDLWRNGCTCREHRIQKQRPCRHRLALWLAEGVQVNDPDPVLYLKTAQVEQPDIIAWYAQVGKLPYRIEFSNPNGWAPGWILAFPLDGGDWQLCKAEDLYYLKPFYE